MSRRRLPVALLLASACANHQKVIDDYRASYQNDTLILEKLVEPMGVEPKHGQVTVAVTQPFAEKILLSSLHPNVLNVSVQQKGRVWKEEGKKLGMTYDNGVWLNVGEVALQLNAGKLVFDGDTLTLQTTVEGQGAINADLRFYGVTVNRDVVLAVHHDEPLALKLLAQDGGWVMKAVGDPLHVQVNVKTPALTIAGTRLYELKLDRSFEVALDKIQPWALPLPAPQAVKVGPQTISVGLKNYQLGAHTGVLWLGADLAVGDAPVPAPGPGVAPAPVPVGGAPATAVPASAAPASAPAPAAEPLGPAPPPGFVPTTPQVAPAPAAQSGSSSKP